MAEETIPDNFELVAKWGAIITGMVLIVPMVAILGAQSIPLIVTGMIVAFIAWALVRSGALEDEDENASSAVTAADPLTTLQERYAAGEISEAEFEHRVERIMESDDQLRQAGGPDRSRGEAFSSKPPREEESDVLRERE
jgi:uncharacterized membrane protein